MKQVFGAFRRVFGIFWQATHIYREYPTGDPPPPHSLPNFLLCFIEKIGHLGSDEGGGFVIGK